MQSFPFCTGYSYDPRVQSAFRYWDDYLTNLHYLMMPYLTRPHFWSVLESYPLVLVYELTHDEKILDRAYNNILGFYGHYNFGYAWNQWGVMKLGQGHPAFLPSIDLHTQERICADQDSSFVTYLETFGSRCYLTPQGKLVNASKEGERIHSWAPYPREYHLDDRKIVLQSKPYCMVIPWLEHSGSEMRLLVRNLSRNPTDGYIYFSGVEEFELLVHLEGYCEQVLSLSNSH